MIFVGPFLDNKNSHFRMNIIDSISSESDLIIDTTLTKDYLILIKEYLLDKSIEKELVIYNPHTNEDFLIAIKREIPPLRVFMFCSDDEWRCFNYDRYLALYADFFSITDSNHINYYHRWGFDNVIKTSWACNPNIFYPLSIQKDYDVTFIGAPYGLRVKYIRKAIKEGLKVKVFGKGWNKYPDIKPYWGGYLSSDEINEVINRSKINLNFIWSSRGGEQVKGRNFELGGCNAFQICNDSSVLSNYFIQGENIATFNGVEDFVEKIKFYLDNEPIRNEISRKAYDLVCSKYTWNIKFKEIFDFICDFKEKKTINKRYRLLFINDFGFSHKVFFEDPRIDFVFIDDRKPFDGVIKLSSNSTLNNDVLFMMLFALDVDSSDVVLSNFYLKDKWIRFKEDELINNKNYMKYLPMESRMYSSISAFDSKLDVLDSYSFIEYPLYEILDVGGKNKAILNFLFSDINGYAVNIKKNINSKKYFKALFVLAQYLYRRVALK